MQYPKAPAAQVCNVAGEVVFTGRSDAEAARWYLESGREGDYLADTGELMSKVAKDVLDVEVRFDLNGCVVS
jgi:hypothetical protein